MVALQLLLPQMSVGLAEKAGRFAAQGIGIGLAQLVVPPQAEGLGQARHGRRLHPGLARLLPHGEQRHLAWAVRSEEHTSELQSLMSISYAVFCLKKKQYTINLHFILVHYTLNLV